jgi:hypothetical protein
MGLRNTVGFRFPKCTQIFAGLWGATSGSKSSSRQETGILTERPVPDGWYQTRQSASSFASSAALPFSCPQARSASGIRACPTSGCTRPMRFLPWMMDSRKSATSESHRGDAPSCLQVEDEWTWVLQSGRPLSLPPILHRCSSSRPLGLAMRGTDLKLVPGQGHVAVDLTLSASSQPLC